MWIASDSAYLYPILIEIETPWKKWWQSAKHVTHSDLTAATAQVAHWRRWFKQPANQENFYRHYDIPRRMQDLTLAPRYVIVHGRRSEANKSRATIELRGNLSIKEDTHLVTFDRLEPDPRFAGYGTVTLTEDGFAPHPLSPITVAPPPDGSGGDDHAPGYRFRPPRRRRAADTE
jgi:hypothetical protein